MANESEDTGVPRCPRRLARSTARHPRIRCSAGADRDFVSTIAVTLGIAHPADAATPQAKRQRQAEGDSRSDGAPTAGGVARLGVGARRVHRRRGRHRERHRRAVRSRHGRGARRQRTRLVEPHLPRTAARAAGHGRSASKLRLRRPSPTPEIARHVVVEGDTIRRDRSGVRLDGRPSVLSANGLGPSSLIFPGQAIVLHAPSRSTGARAGIRPRTPAGPEPAVPASPRADRRSPSSRPATRSSRPRARHGVTVAGVDRRATASTPRA